jgi:hypothetical protein
MAYIGNTPEIGFNTLSVQKFNGDGACTMFSISQPISDPNYLEILVNNVQQEPYAAYDVTSGVITFTEAPSVGANNIQIGYKSQSVVYYNQITSSQLVDGSIGGTKLIDGSVTGNKLGVTAVGTNNIVVGAITGNLIAVGAVTTNHIVVGAVTGNLLASNIINSNNIVDGSILGNDLGIRSVSGNNIGIGAITGNMIGSYAISGNQISTGAISANNFAGGGITSNVFSSNLTISTVRVAETVNVVTTGISGNYNIHVANTTAYYFVANTTGSVTFNLVANSAGGATGSLNGLLSIGQTASLAIALKQGVTRYRANVFIDGVNPLSSVYWMGATQPSQLATQAQSLDVYNITVIKVADSAYTVMVGNTTFGYANGSGMGPGGVQ